MPQQNLEGVILIKDKEGNITGFIRNDLELRKPILYKAEPMNFQDTEELFK